MARSRYDDMLVTLRAQGWSQQEIDAYVENFEGIYEEVCRSIKEKSQKNGKSGLEQNEIFNTLRRDVKYEMAAVATERIREGKPFTMYTDSVRGPQGDLRLALHRVGYLKNYIPNLIGVKIPLADKSAGAKQINDKHAIGPMQLFSALDRKGVMNIHEYYSYLIDRADEVMASKNCQPVITSEAMPMFSSLSGYALRAKMESDGRVYPRDSREYIGRYKYAQVRFLETVIDKMETEGTFAFTFKDHAPAGDLEEALAGTIFATRKVKGKDGSVESKVIFSDRGQISDDPVIIENIMPDSSYKGKDRFCGTASLFLTRAGLDLYGHREKVVESALTKKKGSSAMTFPVFENTALNEQLSMYYSDTELYLLANKYRDVSNDKYRKPIFKGFSTKPTQSTVAAAAKTSAPTPKKAESKAAAPRSLVFIPSGIVPNPKSVKSHMHKAFDFPEGAYSESAEAMARLSLSNLQRTVHSDVAELPGYLDEILDTAIAELRDENPSLSDTQEEIYRNLSRGKVYDMVRHTIDREGKATLGFDKKGPTGEFREKLDEAHGVYKRRYKGTPDSIDYRSVKGFNMDPTQVKVSTQHGFGDMTIDSDGKITITENARSMAKSNNEDKVQ